MAKEVEEEKSKVRKIRNREKGTREVSQERSGRYLRRARGPAGCYEPLASGVR